MMSFADVLRSCRTAALASVFFFSATLGALANHGTTISGRILDVQTGLPVVSATVELLRDGHRVAVAKTDADGVFRFRDRAPGTYDVLIRAIGYQTTRAPQLPVAMGEPEVSFETAIDRQAAGMREIAYVATAGRAALQTTTTIDTHIDTNIVQSENYQRLGDVLTSVPGVITATSSSVGDDMSLSIRGYDPTETATLLDGHPIGPIGAFGNGYNFNVSPFWGLSGADVIFGSGASGLFGASTIAGAVNFETINPTRHDHVSVTQGVGSNDKLMSGFLGTGTVGKLGYAFAWGSRGTTGNFPTARRLQRALLQSSAVHPAYAGNAPPPDLTAANVNSDFNNYVVSGGYSQKNFVGKLRYAFSPRTSLQLTAYSATDWSNSTGNGDNDYQTYPYVLYGAQQTIAGLGNNPNTILVNGQPRSCYHSIAVLEDVPAGYTCMTAKQYATAFYGPFGGGVDRLRSLGNQDYDARATQLLGAGVITLEAYADAYNYNAQKGPPVPYGPYGPGPYYLNLYKTRGYLVSDDFASSKNDVAFGYTWLRQTQNDGAFPYTLADGTTYPYFGYNPQLSLATASYFVTEDWTPSYRFSSVGSFWIQRSVDTHTTSVNPRLSFVYRPDPSDVVRLTGGRSYSEPDPSLIALAPPVYGSPTSVNCPSTTTGSSALTAIASEADPNLKPETAQDLEVAVGHRFTATTNLQVDLYQSWESDALLGGLVPISQIPQVSVPAALVTRYLQRLSQCPGLNPTPANLAFSTTYNAAGARYRGIVVSAQSSPIRNSAAQQYGLIGAGVFQPQNYYGSAAQGGPTSAVQQGAEEFGLPFRSYWLTVKVGV